MVRAILALLVVALTGGLTAAAIALVPQTLYFPVIEFSTPDKLSIRILQHGELEAESCARTLSRLRGVIHRKCATCTYVERCVRGLDDERKKDMSHEPIGMPSARNSTGTLTMTFWAKDPGLALNACRAVAEGASAGKGSEQMACFAAGQLR